MEPREWRDSPEHHLQLAEQRLLAEAMDVALAHPGAIPPPVLDAALGTSTDGHEAESGPDWPA